MPVGLVPLRRRLVRPAEEQSLVGALDTDPRVSEMVEVSEACAHLPREVVVGVDAGWSGTPHEDRSSTMLTLTENAQVAVQDLTQNVEDPEAGLRITSEQDQLAVSVVTGPEPTDVVVDAGEAHVYIAQDTAPALDDQVLDATRTPDGVGFMLTSTA